MIDFIKKNFWVLILVIATYLYLRSRDKKTQDKHEETIINAKKNILKINLKREALKHEKKKIDDKIANMDRDQLLRFIKRHL